MFNRVILVPCLLCASVVLSQARAQNTSTLGADVGNYVTATMDGYYAWYEQGFDPNAPTTGLPHPGITNAVTGSAGTGGPAGTFLMQPYNGNNVLLLNGNHRLGTLTLANATSGNAFWLTDATGFGPAHINTITHFADGTPDFTQNYVLQPDWYNTGQNVFNTAGRVDVHPYDFAGIDSIPGDFNAGGLRVGITTIVFPNPAVHPISSIDIDWYSGSTDPQFFSNTGIFGVSVSTNGAAGPFTAVPLTPSSFNQDVVVESSALTQPVPEPGLTSLLASGLLFLRRRRPTRTRPKASAEPLESRTLLSTTWTVASTADDGSAGTLRSIIAGAAAGDSVVFDSAVFSMAGSPHAIALNTPIEIAHDIDIQGPAANVLTIDGNNTTRGLIIDTGAHLTLSGATFTQCNNTVDTSGGAIFVQTGATLSVQQSVFSNNTGNRGGAIFNQGACVVIDSSFSGNTATATFDFGFTQGGGGAIENLGTLNVSGTAFFGNQAVAGGAIDNYGDFRTLTPATITNSTFQSNTATGRYGAGGAVSSGGNLTVSGCIFTANSDTHPSGAGGAASVYDGTANYTACLFSGNTAKSGSAMFVQGMATVTNSTFDSNTASNMGTIDVVGVLNVVGCTLSNNSASIGAGAGVSGLGTLRVINTTVANNTSAGDGGGFYNSGTLYCTNVTISHNVGYSAGGIYSEGTLTLNNTIVSGNTNLPQQPFQNTIQIPDIDGITTGSFNLIGATGTGGLVNGVNYNIVGATAALSQLADFGGPTKTMALLPGSLAFNTGYIPLAVDQNSQALSIDQRGLPRVASSSVDIGAYEAKTPASAPSNLTAAAAPDQINVNWSNNGSNGPFALYRGTSPGGEDAVPIASQITNSFADKNVLRGVTYYYRVAAADAFGHGTPSNEDFASPIPIGPIISSDGQASLTFIRDADKLHINWTFGAASGQFPAGDPNPIVVLGNPTITNITLDPTNGDAMPKNLRLDGTFTFYSQQNFPFFGDTIDIDRSTVYFVLAANTFPKPVAAVQEYLQFGYAGGMWNGIGITTAASITSSAITADMVGKYSIGYADSADHVVAGQPANTIEVRFTIAGDANLDGVVDMTDANTLRLNYNLTGSPAWDKANFNYNSKVDGSDALLLGRNLLSTTLPAVQTSFSTAITPPVTSAPALTSASPNAALPPAPATTNFTALSGPSAVDSHPENSFDTLGDHNAKHRKPSREKHHR